MSSIVSLASSCLQIERDIRDCQRYLSDKTTVGAPKNKMLQISSSLAELQRASLPEVLAGRVQAIANSFAGLKIRSEILCSESTCLFSKEKMIAKGGPKELPDSVKITGPLKNMTPENIDRVLKTYVELKRALETAMMYVGAEDETRSSKMEALGNAETTHRRAQKDHGLSLEEYRPRLID